ncbi:MAG: Gfo/Idh/MocA family oxidoreductase [Candidatus Hydrogenedentes bacterium]|nr:Gfo/Idh/MocA family oxidoreductase [Candidatus Hydrogenedentota bacterium]
MIRIGVVGGGTYGESHLSTFKDLEQTGRVKLAALAEMNDERREQRRQQFDIPVYKSHVDMLKAERLDGVTVATPDHLHRDIALDVLGSDLPCMVEKPLDVTVDGCRKIIALAAQKSLLLQVDFHKRFDPYHIEMRESFLEGKFGEVEYGYAWMEDQLFVPVSMLRAWSEHSSPVWFLGVHMYDLARWIMGLPAPAVVYATGSRKKLKSMGIDCPDAVQAHVTFSNGACITFHNSWILPDQYEAVVHQGIKLVGTEGIFECDSQYRGGRGCLKGEKMRTWNLGIKYRERDKRNTLRHRVYFYSSIADFAENLLFLKEGGTLAQLEGLYPSGADGLAATQIACAAEESMRTGRPIEIN